MLWLICNLLEINMSFGKKKMSPNRNGVFGIAKPNAKSAERNVVVSAGAEAPVLPNAEARGWPVVGTGMGRGDREGHVLWCRRLGLPAESHDFSTYDVFDVLEFLLAREKARERVNVVLPDPDPARRAMEARARISASVEGRRAEMAERLARVEGEESESLNDCDSRGDIA